LADVECHAVIKPNRLGFVKGWKWA
jgi:hypothetical protein